MSSQQDDNMQGEKATSIENRRNFRRVECPDYHLESAFEFPGGDSGTFHLKARNISRGGLSLHHDREVPIGTTCRILLPRTDGTHLMVEGAVRRCRNIAMMVHDLGIEFDHVLPADEFELLLFD